MAFQPLQFANVAYVGTSNPVTGTRGARMFIYGNSDGDSPAVVQALNYFLPLFTGSTGGVPIGGSFGVAASQRVYASGDWIYVPQHGTMLRLQLDSESAPTAVTVDVSGGFAAGGSVAANIVDSTLAGNTVIASTGVLAAGTYRIDGDIFYNSAATTTGITLGLTLPASATSSGLASATTGAATRANASFALAASGSVIASADSLTTGNYAQIDGTVTIVTPGVVSLYFTTEVDGSAITVLPGSSFRVSAV